MNNISHISKAKRLTEEEVHTAADELKENGVKVSSIEVYKFLGRGSLTTITNFLKTWNQEETMTALPALISLPESLSKAAEQLIIKLWAESQILADKEINVQREALRQAEALAAEKIAEAEAFSEEQAAKIEALETQIEAIQKDRDEQHSDWIKEIEKAHNERHSESIKLATCEQKLNEAEKRFDYVNNALLEQQQTNQELIAENITLKAKLEADLQKLEKSEDNLKKAEERTTSQETGNKKAEIKIEVQRNQIDQLVIELKDQKELTAKEASDNKALREKAAKLEGELMAWKEIKPEAKKATLAKPEKNQ
jgi:chromosome segregation ATPase